MQSSPGHPQAEGHDLWASTVEIRTVCKSSQRPGNMKDLGLPVPSNQKPLGSKGKLSPHLHSHIVQKQWNQIPIYKVHIYSNQKNQNKNKDQHLKTYYSCYQIKFVTIFTQPLKTWPKGHSSVVKRLLACVNPVSHLTPQKHESWSPSQGPPTPP